MRLGKLECPPFAEEPCPGTARWVNPHNQFTIFALHYSADERKRTSQWKEEASRGVPPADWDQEYELDFESWSGQPVYSSFRQYRHVSQEKLTWTRRRHMWRGWDLGCHAVVWAQLCDGHLYIYGSRQTIGSFGPKETRYREHELDCSGLSYFIDRIKELSAEWFPGAQWKDAAPPDAWHETKIHQGTPIRIFHAAGLRPIPSPTQDIQLRVDSVESWLLAMEKGEPALLIDPSAIVVIDAFAGGYARSRDGAGYKPEKDSGYDHPMDGLQTITLCLPMKSRGRSKPEETLKTGLDPAYHDFGGPAGRRPEPESWLSY